MKPILWIDLETTGLKASRDLVLEIACVITDENFEIVDQCQAVIAPASLPLAEIDPYVRAMHTKNGLFAEICAGAGLALDVADLEFEAWIGAFQASAAGPLLLGGSTPSFDRGFLEHHMPRVAGRLHYRSLDVTSISELAARTWPDVYENRPRPASDVEHRAMPDILHSITTARYYREALGARKR